jgi:hypothetical protein
MTTGVSAGTKIFFSPFFVFQRQRPTVDDGADLFDIRVRHRALRPEL